MEKMLKKLVDWGKICGISFNKEKTVVVLFSRKRKEPSKKLTFDGVKLDYSETVKYLGVTLDRKLHWKTHIHQKN